MSKKMLTGWKLQIGPNGDNVQLIRNENKRLSILKFEADGNTSTIILSDEALQAVVALAVNRAGVPVLVHLSPADRQP